jgi:hypothetical protein
MDLVIPFEFVSWNLVYKSSGKGRLINRGRDYLSYLLPYSELSTAETPI